jgi:hypothetical protein
MVPAGPGGLTTEKERFIMASKQSRSQKLTGDQQMADGVQKFLNTLASLPVGSTSVTPADMVKVLQDRIASGKAVLAADAARAAAVKADRDKRAQTAAFVQSLRRIVLGMFSQSPDTLAAFGLKAPKAVKKTVEAKSAAVAKSKATRAARGTKGTKQKKAIKGGTTTAATPVATTAAPATAAAPTTASAPAASPAAPAKPSA